MKHLKSRNERTMMITSNDVNSPNYGNSNMLEVPNRSNRLRSKRLSKEDIHQSLTPAKQVLEEKYTLPDMFKDKSAELLPPRAMRFGKSRQMNTQGTLHK